MTDLTDYGEGVAMAALFPSTPTALFVALHTGDPGEAGSANEVAAGSGYARVSANFTRTGGTATNDATITFGPATADKGTVTHVSIKDASSGGNTIWKKALPSSRAWPSGTLTWQAGDLDFSID